MRAVAVFLAVCLLSASLATPAGAQDREQIPIRFKSAELADIVERLAPALGERFVYDATLTGRVTIAVPRPVSKGEAWQLLNAALGMRGFAALPIPGGGYKIVPLSASADSDPLQLGAADPEGEERILTLIPLRVAAIAELLPIVRPLLDPTTIALPLTTTNSLLVATTERRVVALTSLLRGLDLRDGAELQLRTLRERDAATALDVILARYGEEDTGRHGVSIWSDPRTNTLIYRAPPAQRLEIADILDELDQPTQMPGQIAVLPLRHAEAESVAAQVMALAADDEGALATRSPLAGAALSAVADPGTQSLVVNAAPEVLAIVRNLVAELDRPPKQVAVDVLVQEWAYDGDLDLAVIGFTVVGKNPIARIEQISDPGGFRGEAAQDSLVIGIDDGLLPTSPATFLNRLQLVADQNEIDTATLLRPNLVLLSGEEQSLFVGNNVPVPSAPSEQPEGADSLTQRTNIERRDTGIELRLRASVGAEYAARLEVNLDIENLRSSLAGDPESVGPTFTQRGVDTTVELLPGQTLLIAGDTEGFVETTRTGIPFLMNLPFIQHLVSTTSSKQRRARIVVALQADALPDSDALLAHSIQRRIAFERAAVVRDAISEGLPASGFAVRLATESTREAAAALARQHESEGHPARVVAWSGISDEYFDVHLTGYGDYIEAADEAYHLNTLGLRSDVIPLGGAGANLQ
jgi:general secretion pathway protein D